MDRFRITSHESTESSSDEMWTVGSILTWIEGYLAHHGDAHARLSAQWLVSDALHMSRIALYADLDRPLTLEERAQLREETKRRATGEPLQYITGTTDFRFNTIQVQPGVLIPRPETEVLVSEAFEDVTEPHIVVDIGTGTGCIACSVATEYPDSHVYATDIDPHAVEIAQRNARMLGVDDRLNVIEGDLGEGIPSEVEGMCDLVISNPPYIPTAVLADLDEEVTAHEPRLALDGGDDGLDVLRRLIPAALILLKPGGVLAVELYETTLDQAATLARQAGMDHVRIACDLTHRPRVLIAHRA